MPQNFYSNSGHEIPKDFVHFKLAPPKVPLQRGQTSARARARASPVCVYYVGK